MTFLSSASTKILESIFPTKTFFPIKIQDQRDIYRSFSLKTTSWSAEKEKMFLIPTLVFSRCFYTNEQQPSETVWISLIDNCLHRVFQFLRSFHNKIYGRHNQKGPGKNNKI